MGDILSGVIFSMPLLALVIAGYYLAKRIGNEK